jgi:hypothetical protein
MTSQTQIPAKVAGFSLAEWCKSTSISRAKLYQMPPELQPTSVKIGRRRIICEDPSEWLKRMVKQSAMIR